MRNPANFGPPAGQVPTGSPSLNYGLYVTSWRDPIVLEEVSIHLTLIIETDGVSRFSTAVAVPQELACQPQAKVSQVTVRRQSKRNSETPNQLLLRGGPARQPEILERH